jgi:hypothetical protein
VTQKTGATWHFYTGKRRSVTTYRGVRGIVYFLLSLYLKKNKKTGVFLNIFNVFQRLKLVVTVMVTVLNKEHE